MVKLLSCILSELCEDLSFNIINETNIWILNIHTTQEASPSRGGTFQTEQGKNLYIIKVET